MSRPCEVSCNLDGITICLNINHQDRSGGEILLNQPATKRSGLKHGTPGCWMWDGIKVVLSVIMRNIRVVDCILPLIRPGLFKVLLWRKLLYNFTVLIAKYHPCLFARWKELNTLGSNKKPSRRDFHLKLRRICF